MKKIINYLTSHRNDTADNAFYIISLLMIILFFRYFVNVKIYFEFIFVVFLTFILNIYWIIFRYFLNNKIKDRNIRSKNK